MPPTILISFALGSILLGFATPAEAAAMGAFGAILLSIAYRKFTIPSFFDSLIKALEITVLIMFLVAASNFFGAQFSALGTPKMLTELLLGLEMSPYLILLLVMALIFLLGWPLEWVPIVLIVVPILLPTVEALSVHGLDRYDLMVWFGILVAVNLQTAWLSPPVALSAYFLKGVVPNWDLKDIYLGMMQFMLVQLLGLILIFIFPQLVLWLPKVMGGEGMSAVRRSAASYLRWPLIVTFIGRVLSGWLECCVHRLCLHLFRPTQSAKALNTEPDQKLTKLGGTIVQEDTRSVGPRSRTVPDAP